MFTKEGTFCELLATYGQKLKKLFHNREFFTAGSHFLIIVIMIPQDLDALHDMPSVLLLL